MPLKERNQQLALAAELLQVHLPAVLKAGDQALARDLLCAFIAALHAVEGEVEEAAKAWEEREFGNKADALRREWSWTDFAIRYADVLRKGQTDLEVHHLERLSWLIPITLEPAGRHKVSNPEKLRGYCQNQRAQQRAASAAPAANTEPAPAARKSTKAAPAPAAKDAPAPAAKSPKRTPRSPAKSTRTAPAPATKNNARPKPVVKRPAQKSPARTTKRKTTKRGA